MTRGHVVLLTSLGLAFACASTTPSPGLSGISGTVQAVPREGVDAGSSGGAYGDRRLRDATLVDYGRPGFTVVYVKGDTVAAVEPTRLSIRMGAVGVRIEPTHSAVGIGGRIRLANADVESHFVSIPAEGIVRELTPGAEMELEIGQPGDHTIFLLDVPGSECRVFAAPGPFVVATPTGRFRLVDLAPGRHRVHVWHPRLPPTAVDVHLVPDEVRVLDLALGVGQVSDMDDVETGIEEAER